jgi:hypothetical protein
MDSVDAVDAPLRFESALRNLTYERGDKLTSKACLICDRLLEWNDTDFIKSTRLKTLQKRFQGESKVFETPNRDKLKCYYTYRGPGRERFMKEMYLSP